MTNSWRNCWVINVKNPLDCWLIDDDSTKPIYLENNFPKYDRARMMEFRLSNSPTEEYLENHPQKKEDGQIEGQMTLEDFLGGDNQ